MSRELLGHLERLAGRLEDGLGDLLVAVWAGGSVALDDVRPDSDLDVAVVVDRAMTEAERGWAAEDLLTAADDVPARGLEAVVYARGDLTRPGDATYQVNVNGGPGMEAHVGLPGDDPAFWFVVDLAILRSAGRSVLGPSPDELIAEVPEHAVRDALRRSVVWHREHGRRTAHEVLNACRAWHHLVTGGWMSKSEAATWAAGRLRGEERAAVEAAAAHRADPGRSGPSESGARLVSTRVLALLDPDVQRLAAFAERPGGGNPAGVVLTPSPLPPEDMQRIAADVGYSETAFLVPSSLDRRRWDVRYFAPEAEVPFCGHATIAAGVVLGRGLGPGSFVLDTVGGPVTVEVSEDAEGTVATLTSIPPRVERAAPELLAAALPALRIAPAALDDRYAPAVSDAGARHLILVLADRSTLSELDYDVDGLREVMRGADLTTVALLWRESGTRWHARNPFPVGGVVEDPATGAAAAAFGAYLRDRGHVEPPTRLEILQGHDMGRPSLLTVEIPPGDAGIRVSGTAEDVAG